MKPKVNIYVTDFGQAVISDDVLARIQKERIKMLDKKPAIKKLIDFVWPFGGGNTPYTPTEQKIINMMIEEWEADRDTSAIRFEHDSKE